MDAIKLIKQQHRLVEKLFKELDKAEEDGKKRALFFEIADNLAVHATIEEHFFYPAVRKRQTEQEIEEAYDEHLEIKKLLVDAMNSTERPGWDGMVAALKGAVEHHVEEEEDEILPEAGKLLDKEVLEALGAQMEAEGDELMEAGDPRKNVQVETEPPVIQP